MIAGCVTHPNVLSHAQNGAPQIGVDKPATKGQSHRTSMPRTLKSWEKAMRVLGLSLLIVVSLPFTAGAQGSCSGQTVTKTSPNGKTLTLCLDGKHATCLRDSQRLGHSEKVAKRFCDGKNLRK